MKSGVGNHIFTELKGDTLELSRQEVERLIGRLVQHQKTFKKQVDLFDYETECFVKKVGPSRPWREPLTLWLNQFALFRKELYYLKHGIRSISCHFVKDDPIRKRSGFFLKNLCNSNFLVTQTFDTTTNHSKMAVCCLDGVLQEIRLLLKSKNKNVKQMVWGLWWNTLKLCT